MIMSIKLKGPLNLTILLECLTLVMNTIIIDLFIYLKINYKI